MRTQAVRWALGMAARRWLKGNTHTHTTYSDGDSAPEVVVDWYAEHGYDFLFLTDHNILIPDDHVARLQHRALAVWQGEEITMSVVHVNGLGIRERVLPHLPSLADSAEEIRWATEQVLAQDGVASVNHPDFPVQLSPEDLLASGPFALIEVANGNHRPRGGRDTANPWSELLWDRLLTDGRRVWAVASDDAHHFKTWGSDRANPGRGWIQVEADAREPDLDHCLEALRQGRFYASTGLELADYRASVREVAVDLASEGARIELVGGGGQVLEVIDGPSARFRLAESMAPYLRVRAIDAERRKLWTQPVLF